VATSIESDIDNLINLMTVFNVFPPGLFIKEAVAVAKQELALECDYRHEALFQEEYRQKLASTPALQETFVVPELVPQLSAQRVISGTWVPGVAIDQVKESTQAVRDRVGTALLSLTLQVSSSVATSSILLPQCLVKSYTAS
jgi:aarF domain-containing kinase